MVKFVRFMMIAIPAALIAIFIRTFIFGFYVVPSSSMVPSLYTGDHIVAAKYAYGYSGVGTFDGKLNINGRIGGSKPVRGDVIVFRSRPDGMIVVKRLIGLPGDKIQIMRGEIYINGTKVERQDIPGGSVALPNDGEPTGDYANSIEFLPEGRVHLVRHIRNSENDPLNNVQLFIVPPGEYFFLGDNRDRSDDSRRTEMGYVPEEDLIGRAQTVLFSYDIDQPVWDLWKWDWAMRWRRMMAAIH